MQQSCSPYPYRCAIHINDFQQPFPLVLEFGAYSFIFAKSSCQFSAIFSRCNNLISLITSLLPQAVCYPNFFSGGGWGIILLGSTTIRNTIFRAFLQNINNLEMEGHVSPRPPMDRQSLLVNFRICLIFFVVLIICYR